jgi:hypothetical protein
VVSTLAPRAPFENAARTFGALVSLWRYRHAGRSVERGCQRGGDVCQLIRADVVEEIRKGFLVGIAPWQRVVPTCGGVCFWETIQRPWRIQVSLYCAGCQDFEFPVLLVLLYVCVASLFYIEGVAGVNQGIAGLTIWLQLLSSTGEYK